VAVEGLGGVEVAGDEGLEPAFVEVFAFVGVAGDGYVGAAGTSMSIGLNCDRNVVGTYALKNRPLDVRTVMKMSSLFAIWRRYCEMVK
jgi:hypothetical protein